MSFHPSHQLEQHHHIPYDYWCTKCAATELNGWLKYSCKYVQEFQKNPDERPTDE